MDTDAAEYTARAARFMEGERKRTHDEAQLSAEEDAAGAQEEEEENANSGQHRQKRARFEDPVLKEEPSQPIVLTQCGHTVDASYLSDLQATAKERTHQFGYACPTCNAISMRTVPNYALEDALNINVANREVPDTGIVHSLTQKESFRAVSEKLRDTIARLDAQRLQTYLGVTEMIVAQYVLPAITERYATTYYHGNVVYHGLSVIPVYNLRHIFNSKEALYAWMSYDNGRYKHELVESHGLTLKVQFWKKDGALTKKAKGTNTWYNQCKFTDTLQEWDDVGVTFDFSTAEDHFNCTSA